MVTRRQFVSSALAVPGALVSQAGAERSPRRFRFFLWNDMHVRAQDVPGRPPGYPCAEDKARWALECALGLHDIEPPDFVVSGGDIIDGELEDFDRDFRHLRSAILDRLAVPFLPCVGNHENAQGEGVPGSTDSYDRCFGASRRNYAFTCGGFAFVVLDTSGAHRLPDAVTAARNAQACRMLERLSAMPLFLVTHVPLVPMRDEPVLKESFGFSSYKVLDPGLLEALDSRAEPAIAVLTGHLHLTGALVRRGVCHITCGGTCGYPADFAAFDVYDDRVDVAMHRAPERWLDRGGDIHGIPRYARDFTDARHVGHEDYVWGTPGERSWSVPLDGARRPRGASSPGLRLVDAD